MKKKNIFLRAKRATKGIFSDLEFIFFFSCTYAYGYTEKYKLGGCKILLASLAGRNTWA